jgi:hypothetical protein
MGRTQNYLITKIMKKVTINNEVYVLEKDIKKGVSIPTKKQIVILNRGWVVVGDFSNKGDDCTLQNASVIRTWGTDKGLGQLAEQGPLTNTKLDPCPNVHFSKMTMVARMDVNESKWS